MGHPYRAVGWNRQKRIYDLSLTAGVLVFVTGFALVGAWQQPHITVETLLIRGLGLAALVLLHIALSIGPLARLDPRFLPLLYNRRHLGVTMFLVALGHGLFSLIQFHALGDLNPILSVLISDGSFDRGPALLPFQPLGLLALILLFLMAATSHDFWLKTLGPPVWKTLHLVVYPAYFLVVMHVALGALQVETHPLPTLLVLGGSLWVAGLHFAAWAAQRRARSSAGAGGRGGASAALGFGAEPERGAAAAELRARGWHRLCPVDDIPENRAATFEMDGARVAVFRYDGKLSAVSNTCAHQNGPLGEGRIIDGCITCPWHGYQYRPEDGASPPPFEERIPTYRLQVVDDTAWILPEALPPGTFVEPARIATSRAGTVTGTDSRTSASDPEPSP